MVAVGPLPLLLLLPWVLLPTPRAVFVRAETPALPTPNQVAYMGWELEMFIRKPTAGYLPAARV